MKQLLATTLIIFIIIAPVHATTIREDNSYKLAINLSGSLQNPAFAPTGDAIVFTNFRNGYNEGPADIYSYNLTTKKLHLLVSDGSDNVNLPGHIWLNHTIVFSSSREPHDEIYTINENGLPGDEIKITARTNLVAYEPSFSKDGEWVVFESHVLDHEDDGVITKYRVDATGNYIALASGVNAKQPNFSPIDDLIIYQRYDNKQWDIWMMQDDGSNNHRLTQGIGSSTDASFSADGHWVIFSKEIPDSDAANLYRISLNGSITEKLTTFSGYDGAPSYFDPFVVFESYNGDPDRSDGTTIWIRDTSKNLISSYNSNDEILYFPIGIILMTNVIILVRKLK